MSTVDSQTMNGRLCCLGFSIYGTSFDDNSKLQQTWLGVLIIRFVNNYLFTLAVDQLHFHWCTDKVQFDFQKSKSTRRFHWHRRICQSRRFTFSSVQFNVEILTKHWIWIEDKIPIINPGHYYWKIASNISHTFLWYNLFQWDGNR